MDVTEQEYQRIDAADDIDDNGSGRRLLVTRLHNSTVNLA